MMFAVVHLLVILQLIVPAIGVQRYDNAIEKLTKGGKLDGKSSQKLDDKSGRKLNDKSSEKLDDKTRETIGDKAHVDAGLTSRVTFNDTADWTFLSGKLDSSSRVTHYDMAEWTGLGEMNRLGVTKYKNKAFKRKRADGKFSWPDAVNREGAHLYSGAKDLTECVAWGWHHPANLFATIPVGSPLIDDEGNIYLGADDAIRKFDASGNLSWSYAPRGQLAAAPTLSNECPSARRLADSVMDDLTAEEEALLRPDWVKGNGSDMEQSLQFFKDFKIGDLIKVKAGSSYRADGSELYSAGDQGQISSVVPDEDGKYKRAVIQWTRTGGKSAVKFDAIKNHFARVEPKIETACTPVLIASTTNGYVFAISLADGLEQWAIQGTSTIAGVKGALAAKEGFVWVATNRCTDRYCYRYRNQTNTLTPGNTVVRALNVVTGVEQCSYVPSAPLWNFNPIWGEDGNVFFNDQEGRLYSLNRANCENTWDPAGGELGTYTEAAAVYDSRSKVVVAMGMSPYKGAGCNPYVAPGILTSCGNFAFKQGVIKGYNASSGRLLWTRTTAHPPASAVVGQVWGQTRLVVTIGFHCSLGSPTRILGMEPHNGGVRWDKEGPTLWTSMCAGDKEGGDIRRATGGRSTCSPGSWSAPVIDSSGDVYVGNQVGELQRWGSPTQRNADFGVQSSLVTGVAFQDSSIALGPDFMAVATCTSLIVFGTSCNNFDANESNGNWTFPPHGYSTD